MSNYIIHGYQVQLTSMAYRVSGNSDLIIDVNTGQSNDNELLERINSYIAENCPQLVLDENSYPIRLAKQEGYDAFVQYMETPQTYKLMTRQSALGIGHHILIQLADGRTCERTRTPGPIEKEQETQREERIAIGSTIEKMWAMHQRLVSSYNDWFGRLTYRPFSSDCHTYVNKILVWNGEPPSTLRRI